MILNKIFYGMMLIGFFGLSVQAPNLRMFYVGLLLTLVNAVLFW